MTCERGPRLYAQTRALPRSTERKSGRAVSRGGISWCRCRKCSSICNGCAVWLVPIWQSPHVSQGNAAGGTPPGSSPASRTPGVTPCPPDPPRNVAPCCARSHSYVRKAQLRQSTHAQARKPSRASLNIYIMRCCSAGPLGRHGYQSIRRAERLLLRIDDSSAPAAAKDWRSSISIEHV